MSNSVVALIPARQGSKRIPGKNVREFHGHPIIAYTIAAARQSGVFDRVIVSTDDPETAGIAVRYGAETPFLRPAEYAADQSPDIQWVRHALERLEDGYEFFSILRPTNPFRQAETIRRAWRALREAPDADTLRAVERCHEHPYKMWRIEGGMLNPLFPTPGTEEVPFHSRPYQALPEVFVQNASLEIARTEFPLKHGRITGDRILAFVSEGQEGFDLNFPEDWVVAEHLVTSGQAVLPEIP
ncbi:acylneuraminate cytidylyltransferase family protein [Pseudodesulfovibrio sp.]|uniref:acylneuraminate cytidylyltransferase family protein n=1 Tax=Pseudodesulfovibrio sp. TaxID=2035812 RepID=UPI002627F987|nr:acylneuraminate cytidylyltransferase family protein [Pseudodesulfovibrio sp.]MDD3313322.1 acylneuraminate cytidylyltransferase family protein [Pseudodesulfovibrio sp.]